MKTTCPRCEAVISMENINVSTDVALCRSCGKVFAFSAVLDTAKTNNIDLAFPPDGAWFQELPDGFKVGATTRSWMAVFLVPFTCVWAGGSVGGLYGSQITKGHFDPASSLFGLPFLLGSIALVSLCAMNIAGKIEITKRKGRLFVFAGIGVVGWTRSYDWADFNSAREDNRRTGMNWNGQGQIIVLEGERRAAFGSMLNDGRRYFVLTALRKMLGSRR